MVAKITVPQSVRRALNYNEQKVKQGKAECLHAENFLKEAAQMSFHEKLERFVRNTELNKSKTNTLHISLNFDTSDKITSERMLEVARAYMGKIGFGNQPYLVYRHHDAGHDHCHIVTTNIRDDGKRIDTFNIGKRYSEPARKKIEEEFGLTRAESKGQMKPDKMVFAERIEYGKSESKRSITNVLDAVIDVYKYSSLHELNAVLRLFNVEADRGKEGSRTHEKRGLHYRILDEKGNKIGVPIKASSIYSKPTLNYLEQRFVENALLKQADKLSVQTAINWTLAQKPSSMKEFTDQLRCENIDVVLRQSKGGQLYGITYVDHGTKCVFNGSDLGKQYAAKGVQEQLRESPAATVEHAKENYAAKDQSHDRHHQQREQVTQGSHKDGHVLEHLLHPESDSRSIAWELRHEERKRRRKSMDLDEEREM